MPDSIIDFDAAQVDAIEDGDAEDSTVTET